MAQIAFVTGADRGLGLALTARLLEKDWHVFAGQYMPGWPELAALAAGQDDRLTLVPLDISDDESVHGAAQAVGEAVERVDLLVNNAGITSPTMKRSIREAQDYDAMRRMYDVNAVGPLRVVSAFLPLTGRSPMKRLCFISSEAGSINCCERKSWYGYCMSKTALNMGISILFNCLRPEGYIFRVYHPGWIRSYMNGNKNTEADLEPEEAALSALAYFLRDRASALHPPLRSDEDRLVMRDWRGREWPW